MSKCTICGQPRSAFVMNNKTVCMKCDDLLFDIEIECDEADAKGQETDQKKNEKRLRTVPTTAKK